MKKSFRKLLILLVLTLVMMVTFVIPAGAASPVKVELGSTETFAVLAGSAITNTGTTTIGGDAGGDVGLYPGTSFGATGVTIAGTSYISDGTGVASHAQTDLVTAYNDAAGRTPTTAITADLGGSTLTTGVYNSASSIGITGTLTLDAQGDPEAVFIFQAGSTLTTASNSTIRLINGARYCRIFWQVGSSATLGTNSVFVGHIFAMTSITVNTGAAVQGQLLARTGAVTLDSNTITNGFCAVAVIVADAPVINLTKAAAPEALPAAGGSVTYSYTVTNPGTVALNNVRVTDDKLSPVTYVAGDVNADNLLQPGETWMFTGETTLRETTTNTATAYGSANGTTVTDSAIATVVVATPVPVTPVPVTPVTVTPVTGTITGGQLPATATPWYAILLIGAGLIFLGVVGFKILKTHE